MSEPQKKIEVVAPKKVAFTIQDVLAQMQTCQDKIAEHTAILKKYEGILEHCTHLLNGFDWSMAPKVTPPVEPPKN